MSQYSILEGFISLRRAVALLRAAEVKDLDFGYNQIAVLYKLSLGNATMSELVEHTYSDKASMTRTVASLQRDGYVRKKADESDGRITIIELTAKGRTRAEKAHEIRSSIGRKLDNCLSVDERKQLSILMEKIVENLK